ncbi:MAG: hypothetical protein SV862_00205 [Pseudomonadota bacterium]|nr:hypothetical protein [Pseudomonadota bacterium]
MTASHGAHASLITVAGREYRVRRDFALICRIEERFGPLREFAERLEGCRFTMREAVDLYRALLADQTPPPVDEDIQDHVIRLGVMRIVTELHPISTAFFFGEERFMKRVSQDKGGAERPPMAPAS